MSNLDVKPQKPFFSGLVAGQLHVGGLFRMSIVAPIPMVITLNAKEEYSWKEERNASSIRSLNIPMAAPIIA
jgi:hypothetical protein